MKTWSWILVVWLAASLACGGDRASTFDQRKAAPALELEQVDGSGRFALAAQKGKVVLIDFWATWCGPCLSELPHLQMMHESYDPNEFAVVGVVLESGSREEIQEFVKERSITYPNLMGEVGSKESFGPFLGYPTKYLIDREGYVVKRYFGVVGDQVARDVEKLVRTGSLNSVD